MQSARLYIQSSELGPPIPSPAGECVPPFTVVPGEGTPSLGGERVGSQFQQGDRHCGNLGIYVTCIVYCMYFVDPPYGIPTLGRDISTVLEITRKATTVI
jgi:hypothetical protein